MSWEDKGGTKRKRLQSNAKGNQRKHKKDKKKTQKKNPHKKSKKSDEGQTAGPPEIVEGQEKNPSKRRQRQPLPSKTKDSNTNGPELLKLSSSPKQRDVLTSYSTIR